MLDGETLFAEHFCNDENDEGAKKTSAAQEINQGVAGGGKNGMNYQGDHKYSSWSVFIFVLLCANWWLCGCPTAGTFQPKGSFEFMRDVVPS